MLPVAPDTDHEPVIDIGVADQSPVLDATPEETANLSPACTVAAWVVALAAIRAVPESFDCAPSALSFVAASAVAAAATDPAAGISRSAVSVRASALFVVRTGSGWHSGASGVTSAH